MHYCGTRSALPTRASAVSEGWIYRLDTPHFISANNKCLTFEILISDGVLLTVLLHEVMDKNMKGNSDLSDRSAVVWSSSGDWDCFANLLSNCLDYIKVYLFVFWGEIK